MDGGGGELIGGDINARTGKKGGRVIAEEEGDEAEGRRSKDEKVNGEGKLLVRRLEEVEWAIFNGEMEGDREGSWTYVGANGQSVIDYVIGNERVRERIERLEVLNRADSDHMPVVAWVGGDGVGEGKKGSLEGGSGNGRRKKEV